MEKINKGMNVAIISNLCDVRGEIIYYNDDIIIVKTNSIEVTFKKDQILEYIHETKTFLEWNNLDKDNIGKFHNLVVLHDIVTYEEYRVRTLNLLNCIEF